jgi:3-dehydroquinate dehydratase/shikimate dehydrogenase
MSDTYRFHEISSKASIFGVIGNPVMHSASPAIHNYGFDQLQLDAIYVPFQVDDLAAFFTLADLLNIRGISVTVPHKESILPFLSEYDENVQITGACNTAIRNDHGWQGFNTDILGFRRPLEKRIQASRLKATVIGAGGAARTVVHALKKMGIGVLILNRTVAKAKKLAETFDCSWGGLDQVDKMEGYNDLIVQTTSAGMKPDENVDPLPSYPFRGSEIVYEIVYAPTRTVFRSRAEKAGCVTIGGYEMLLTQAFEQFNLFTGKELPNTEVLKKAIE